MQAFKMDDTWLTSGLELINLIWRERERKMEFANSDEKGPRVFKSSVVKETP